MFPGSYSFNPGVGKLKIKLSVGPDNNDANDKWKFVHRQSPWCGR